jgi:5-methylcytosine-specific restriction endonuclease McrA
VTQSTDATHCQGCGVPLPPRARKYGKARKWCNEDCARKHRPRKRKSRAKPYEQRQCLRCGADLPAGSRPNRKWCSEGCARQAQKKQAQKKCAPVRPPVAMYCQSCGEQLPSSARANRKWCSPKCAPWYTRRPILDITHWKPSTPRPPARRWLAGYCAECSEPFVTNQPQARFCSDRCARRRSGRVKWQRRRNRKVGNGEAEYISLRAIAERDNWTCHLCQRPVTEKTWSIDHLVPLVHGGAHARSNVALAHRLCNAVRGDLPLKETQLMLVATREVLVDAAA